MAQLQKEREPKPPEQSAFDMNVERMQFLVQLFDGDTDKVRELVNKWIDEAKRRYDASEQEKGQHE
jgi:hypothetical protein